MELNVHKLNYKSLSEESHRDVNCTLYRQTDRHVAPDQATPVQFFKRESYAYANGCHVTHHAAGTEVMLH
jgi:hypothetical protein